MEKIFNGFNNWNKIIRFSQSAKYFYYFFISFRTLIK